MIDRNMSDAEYIAQMKAAWGTQLDPYILTIRNLENKFESLCAQLDELEEQQKAHDKLKAAHRRLQADMQFWFEECDRIKAKQGELKARFDTEKSERMLFEQENAKHQQQRNALRVSLEEALKENARLKALNNAHKNGYCEAANRRGLPTGGVLSSVHPPKPLSIQQLIEGHAEALRKSVSGFPPCIQELKVKEQLGFFEPLLGDCNGYTAGFDECQKTC